MKNIRAAAILTFMFLRIQYPGILCKEPGPEMIVSLAPSVTESVYLLGFKDRLCGVTVYCDTKGEKKEVIGTMLEPNIEKIVSMNPGLVIATKEGNKKKSVETLEKLGVKVYVMDSCDTFSGICESFMLLGQKLGAEKNAKKAVADAKKRIETVRKKAAGRKRVSVFWETGIQPLFTAGKNTYINEIIECAGGENVFADIKFRYAQVSREEALKRDPEAVIIACPLEDVAAERKLWADYSQAKIYALNDTSVLSPTPKAFADGVETVYRFLHGPPERNE